VEENSRYSNTERGGNKENEEKRIILLLIYLHLFLLVVAVKQLHSDLNETDLKSFRAEALLMSNLRPHSNVVLLVALSVCST
jgi:hypothetical protein